MGIRTGFAWTVDDGFTVGPFPQGKLRHAVAVIVGGKLDNLDTWRLVWGIARIINVVPSCGRWSVSCPVHRSALFCASTITQARPARPFVWLNLKR